MTQTNAPSSDFGNLVNIDKDDFEYLKKECAKCSPGGIFKFKGREMLKEYAEYLISYLELTGVFR